MVPDYHIQGSTEQLTSDISPLIEATEMMMNVHQAKALNAIDYLALSTLLPCAYYNPHSC